MSITGPASASGSPARSNSTSGAPVGIVVGWSASHARGAVADVGVQALGEPPQLGGDAGVAVARVGGLFAREPAQLARRAAARAAARRSAAQRA